MDNFVKDAVAALNARIADIDALGPEQADRYEAERNALFARIDELEGGRRAAAEAGLPHVDIDGLNG